MRTPRHTTRGGSIGATREEPKPFPTVARQFPKADALAKLLFAADMCCREGETFDITDMGDYHLIRFKCDEQTKANVGRSNDPAKTPLRRSGRAGGPAYPKGSKGASKHDA